MFSQTPKKRVQEFQAVVLAGYGENLYPLTERENVCKALLPVGNEPMISYTLNWLEQAGIVDVLILTPSAFHPALSHHLQSFRQTQLRDGEGAMKIDLRKVEVLEGADADHRWQTADLLRAFKDSLTTDFIVLPCDFIPPPTLLLSSLLDAHRTRRNAALTALFYERVEVGKDGPEKLLTVIDRPTKSLLHVQDVPDDLDVELRMSMLWKYPGATLTTKLLDSHVYVFKHSVLEMLTVYPQIESIREELVPWLLKGGYQTRLARSWKDTLNPHPDPQSFALMHSTTHLPPSISHPTSIPLSALITHDLAEPLPSAANSPRPSPGTIVPGGSRPNLSRSETVLIGGVNKMTLDDVDSDDDDERAEEESEGRRVNCGVVVHEIESGGFLARGNTVPTYFELNRQFLKNYAIAQQSAALTPPTTPPPVSSGSSSADSPLIDPKAQISTDSIIGTSSRVAERTSIKKSIVGRHCVVGKHVKLVGCVVMDFVRIKDGAKLENCIVCKDAIIGEKVEMRDCEIGGKFEVVSDPSVKVIKGEKLALR